jgi:hypothetical protein
MVFSGFPVASIDYDTHYAQTVRVTIALENFGKPWVWDPRFNAGFPEGTISMEIIKPMNFSLFYSTKLKFLSRLRSTFLFF